MRSSLAELGEELVALRWETLSVLAREKLTTLLLDALGCAVAGARLVPYERFLREQPPGDEATIWFEGRRSSASHAALSNGSLAHHVEMDDGQTAASLHGGVTVVPAALAAGELVGATGREILTAIASGYGAAVACGRGLKQGINDHNLHPPSMVGCLGAAAAAAKLLGLSAEVSASALSLAGTLMPLGPFESFTRGATVKDLYGGWPAFVGIRSAQFARRGLSGPLEVFSSERDGVGTFLAHRAIEDRAIVDSLDWEQALDVYIKPFATCRAVHATLTALEDLLPLDVEAIASIEVDTYPFAAELSHDSDTSTAVGAKTSIPYGIATMLLEGRVEPEAFTERALADRRRRRLAERVEVRSTLEQGAKVTVTFRDDERKTATASGARSETEARVKFRRLARSEAESIEAAVDGLVENGLEPLLAALRTSTPHAHAHAPFAPRRSHRRPPAAAGSLLRRIASWALDSHQVPFEARHAARRLLMDQMGVSLAGTLEIPLAGGEPVATVWSSGVRAHAADVVLQNRIAGDDLELNAGPEVAAAAVAASEIAGSTLGELLDAIAIACEVESFFRSWLQPGVERHGLHPPAVFGALSAAVVSARLLGLNAENFAGAVASAGALTPQSPYVAFSSGMTGKWLYGAFSQMLGLECALWARAGVAGPDSVFEGTRGIAQALLDGPANVPSFVPDGWAVTKVTFKPYRCSRACHPALTAVEKLGPIDPDDIRRVEVRTYPFAAELDQRVRGRSHIAAQMSLRRTVALFLARGALDWKELSAPDVAALDERVLVSSNGTPSFPRRRRAEVRVTMNNGSLLVSESDAKWSGTNPATDEELRARFLAFTRGRRTPDFWEAGDEVSVSDLFGEAVGG